MSKSKHPALDIFAAIYSFKHQFNRLAQDPNLSVRAHASAEPTHTSLTLEVFKNIKGDTLCVIEIPHILRIEDSGDSLVVLKQSRLPAITLVSDGTSTVECRQELPTYFDDDINGETISSDVIAAEAYEQLEPFLV